MIRKRLAVLVASAALGCGAAAAAATAALAGGGDDDHAPTTTAPQAPTPVHLTVPGVGTIAFTLHPDGTATDIVITPDPGVTAGTPTPNNEGFTVPVTAADGTSKVVKVDTEEDGVEFEVEAVEPPEPAENEQANEEQEQPEAEHDNGDHNNGEHHNGEHGTPSTEPNEPREHANQPGEEREHAPERGDDEDHARPGGGDHGDDGHSGGEDHSGGD